MNEGSILFNLIFYLLAVPCISTIGTSSFRYPGRQCVLSNHTLNFILTVDAFFFITFNRRSKDEHILQLLVHANNLKKENG
jgi:hypothetical protein